MHTISKKIYYHDTDSGGVVYYANYLKYFEEARTEILHDKGVSVKELTDKGIWFVVGKVELDYKMPARYADVLTVTTEVVKVKNVSFDFYQEVKRGDEVLVCAKTKLVCVGSNFKPQGMPQDVNERLKA